MPSASRKALLEPYKHASRPLDVGRILNTTTARALIVAAGHTRAVHPSRPGGVTGA
jgi:hypothetical protein